MRRVDLIIEGQPLPKARARVTSRGTYTPKAQREDSDALGWEIKLACKHKSFEGPVAVELSFFRRDHLRTDIDNLIKQVLDSANGIAWKDDSQITFLRVRKGFDKNRPRTEISIYEDEDA